MIYVLDASVAAAWFIAEERHPNADRVLGALLKDPGRFAVPELFGFEVFSVLCRLHPEPLKAWTEGLLPVLEGGILRQPMTESLAQSAMAFVRKGLTGYDACYAGLATICRGKWLTFDRRAHRALRDSHVSFLLDQGMPPGLE
jgi:predicted nucleic acid-binding protein